MGPLDFFLLILCSALLKDGRDAHAAADAQGGQTLLDLRPLLHKVLKKERVFDEETGKGKTRLHFEDELKKPKSKGKLQFEADKTVRKGTCKRDSVAFH